MVRKNVIYSADKSTSLIAVDVMQKSDEWLKWRSVGITATDIPVILGMSPYKTPYQLWGEKTKRFNTFDLSKNPNVQRGVILEDKARQKAEQRCGEILMPICGECIEWDLLRASYDGLTSNFKPHELKAPSLVQWEDVCNNGVKSSAYRLYSVQVEAQCVVAGVWEGSLSFYRETDVGDEEMEFTITLTQERRDEILKAAKEFWHLIETNTPPARDPLRDIYEPQGDEEIFNWNKLAGRWRDNDERVKALEVQLKGLKADQSVVQKDLITMMRSFMQTDIGGVKISRFEKKGAIDYDKFLSETFADKDYSQELENYRKGSRVEARFTRSEDELVNRKPEEIISVKSSFF